MKDNLLNSFVDYLRNDEAAIAKFLVGKTAEETEVVKNFVESVAPASSSEPAPVATPDPAPVAVTPAAPVLPHPSRCRDIT